MPSLHKDTKSILVTTSAQSITIPVTLYKMEDRKITETTALIDNGVTICCINLHFIQRMKLLRYEVEVSFFPSYIYHL